LVLADVEVEHMADAVVGANRADAHLVHVAAGRDFRPSAYHDLRATAAGEPCAACSDGVLEAVTGIVVATARRLAPGETAAWGPVFTAEDGSSQAVRLGAYELGLSRCLAALVEQHHDEAGIAWPAAVAPFAVAVLLLDPGITELNAAAAELSAQLAADGLEPLLDDRDERPGAKFKDADLVGYPVVVVVGKRLLADGLVEVRRRRDRLEKQVAPEQARGTVAELLQDP
jgi:prolyl-tRNA synthetase